MMILCGINNNILISHPSYSSLYQDGAKMRALQRDKYFFGVGTKPKIKLTNGGACLYVDIGGGGGGLIIPLYF